MKRLFYFLLIFLTVNSCKKEEVIYNPQVDLLISEPQNGSVLDKGKTYNIKWETDKAEKLRIDLYLQDKAVSIISVSEPNTGNFNWLVPQNIMPDTNYRIRITSLENNNISAFSHFFEIVGDSTQKYIKPGAFYDNNWIKGQEYTINWQTNVTEDLKVELLERENVVLTVDANAKSRDSLIWTVPASLPSSSYYRFKFSSTVYPDFYEMSTFFRISDANETNLVMNGNFATENHWNYTNPEADPKTRWNINRVNGSGAAEVVSLQSSGTIYQYLDVVEGQRYRVKYTLSRCNGYFGGANQGSPKAAVVCFLGKYEGTPRFQEGTYTDTITAMGSNMLGFKIITDNSMHPNSGIICKLERVEVLAD